MSEITEKLDNAVFSNNDIVSGDIDTDIVTFFRNGKALNSVNLTNINLDDDNFDYYDPKTINHIRLIALYNRFKQNKRYKRQKGKELMPAAWHRTRRWDWCMPENEKKRKKK